MKWEVWKKGARGGSGSRLGTVEASTKSGAVVKAMDEFAALGLNATNIDVQELKPVY